MSKVKKLLTKAYRKLYNSKVNSKKDEKLVLFESFNGRQFSDSPKAIYDYMKVHHPEYKLVWSADRRFLNNFKDVPHVKRMSLKWIKFMNTSKYWVTNSRFPLWIKKSDETFYLQTWHGTPLKKLGLDMDNVTMPGTNTEKYKKNFVKESSKWNLLITPNQFCKDVLPNAFGYNGDIIEVGYPRNDYLVLNKDNEAEINSVKKMLNIPLDKKVILYAPTWRDDEYFGVGRYKFQLQLDIQRMKEKFGDDCVLVLRTHYLIAQNLDVSEFGDFVVDMSQHGDIKELYLISDLLITDYSSVFFDFSILEKPILFFTYDIEKYREQLRGFYFDFEKLAPGVLCENNDSLFEQIENVFNNNYNLDVERIEFIKQFSEWEKGDASKQVVEYMLKVGSKNV